MGPNSQLGFELIDGSRRGGELNRLVLIGRLAGGDQFRLTHGVAEAGTHACAEAISGDSLAQAAREGRLHRNFQGCTTGGELDLLGIGPTAISQFPHLFSQNERSLKTYREALSQGRLRVERGLEVDDSDVLERRAMIRQVMCQCAVSLDLRRFSEEWSLLQELQADGLVRLSVQQGQGQA